MLIVTIIFKSSDNFSLVAGMHYFSFTRYKSYSLFISLMQFWGVFSFSVFVGWVVRLPKGNWPFFFLFSLKIFHFSFKNLLYMVRKVLFPFEKAPLGLLLTITTCFLRRTLSWEESTNSSGQSLKKTKDGILMESDHFLTCSHLVIHGLCLNWS